MGTYTYPECIRPWVVDDEKLSTKKISNSRNISIEFKCFPLISYFCGILSIENWYQRPIKRKDEGDQSETQVTIYIKCLALKSSLRPIEIKSHMKWDKYAWNRNISEIFKI